MSAVTLIQKYPQFVANQVLTQDQLNDMRDFLDSQNRMTRVRLVGIGIVCGLHTKLTINGSNVQLTITEGYGVTSDGWLIHIPETTYTHIQEYIDPYTKETEGLEHPVYIPWQTAYDKNLNPVPGPGSDFSQIPLDRLLTANDPINPSSSLTTSDLQGKVLILYLELNENELKSCFTTDCNNKGQSINLEVEALLAEKGDRFHPASVCKSMPPLQYVPRLNTALKIEKNKTFPQINSASDINDSYRNICDYLFDELDSKYVNLFNNNIAFFDLFDEENRISSFANKLQAIATAAQLNQYHYDVLKDVAQAFNELVQHLCQIVEPCCNAEYFPRHLVIRDFTGAALNKTKGFRHPFYPSPVKNVMYQDFKKARQLFIRILDLVDAPTIPSTSNVNDIKVTPSQNEAAPLAERSIPFYYDKSLVENSWQLDACCTPSALSYFENVNQTASSGSQYADFAYLENPLLYNINASSLLRIEGHVHLNFQNAFDKIITLRRAHHLDFQLVALPLQAPSVPPLPPLEAYEEIQAIWINLYLKIAEGNIDPNTYQELTEKVTSIQEAIISDQKAWCESMMNVDFACDFSALQADYSLLYAELKCFLFHCKPMFNNLPDIELGEGGSPVPQEDCLDFTSQDPGTKYGAEINEPGQVVFDENNVLVSVEMYLNSNGAQLFNSGTLDNVQGEPALITNDINFGFDYDPARLGISVTEVRFTFRHGHSEGNISVNNHPLQLISFREIQEEKEIFPNIFLRVTQLQGNRFEGIIRGEELRKVVLGGVEFLLFGICHFGTGGGNNVQPKELPRKIFDARFDRIRLLCELLNRTLAKDIRCFNFPLVHRALKDMTGAAIEIKLLIGCLMRSVNGAFRPYNYFPRWNDLEDCLDHVHGHCLNSRLAALFYLFRSAVSVGPDTLGKFSQRYPGAEHRAGVSQGGTFILVYESETNPSVVADFSLEHFVKDCCSCKIDPGKIELPPIALPDYRIVRINKPGETIDLTIKVIENDINLEKSDPVKLIDQGDNPSSDRGAKLNFNPAEGEVTYRFEKALEGIDHFTYQIENGVDKDTGHVYISIEVAGTTNDPEKKGAARGLVIEAGFGRAVGTPIPEAAVKLLDPESQEVGGVNTGRNGGFSFKELNAGTYTLSISHRSYVAKEFKGQRVSAGTDVDWGTFALVPRTILEGANDRFAANTNKIRNEEATLSDERPYQMATVFALEKVSDPEVLFDDVANSYRATSDILISSIADPGSNRAKQRALRAVLEGVIHSYLDRLVIEDPDKVSEDAIAAIKATVSKLDDAGIPTKTVLSNWKSNDLKSSIGGGNDAINTIRDLFRN